MEPAIIALLSSGLTIAVMVIIFLIIGLILVKKGVMAFANNFH